MQSRRTALSPELASEIYQHHMTKLFFPTLVTYMSSGPMLVMQLAREKAVSYWKELTGPTNPAQARITHPDRSVRQPCPRWSGVYVKWSFHNL